FLANAIEGCEKWWASVSLVLQRNKALVGATTPWGLIIRPQNYGRTEEEARKFWGYTLSRLGNAVSDLPLDFGLKDWYELAVITSHHEYNSQRLLTSAP
ncbi:MAG: hypothetical protein ACREQ5_10335, partial [Candidatus Dormibacteria bacterium]